MSLHRIDRESPSLLRTTSSANKHTYTPHRQSRPRTRTKMVLHSRCIAICVAGLAMLATVRAFTPEPNAYYGLRTYNREGKCLRGNRFAAGRPLGGATFMDDCRRGSGQAWKFVPVGRNGVYRMKTMAGGPGKCLEGNAFHPSSTLRGAAFMDNCQNVSGQLWKIKLRGAYFTLTTVFREPHGECLEGNDVSPKSTLGGASFMSGCRPFTGQLFKAELL